MRIEEAHFLLHSRLHGNLIHDVLLGSVLDADESETKLDFLVHDHAFSVGTTVHDINFGDHTHSSDALGVDAASHSKTLLGSHISVSSHYAQNDGSGVTHVAFSHATSDLLDVFRLACDGDKGDTWQIDKGQVGTSVRVHIEHDGVIHDVGLRSADLVGQFDDGVSDLLEVGEFDTLFLL